MKKTFLQVLFERLTGVNTSEATEAISKKASPLASVTAEQTIPAEFVFEEPEPPATSPIPPRVRTVSPDQTTVDQDLQGRIADRLIELKVQFGFGPQVSDFIKEARSHADRREVSASFVPFVSYRPTYSSMDLKQKRWYFYWRDLVRQGQFVDTDLSYIYLMAYELINSVGVSGPENGFRQLLVLWRQYRTRYPHLNNYLPDWLEDFAFVHHLTIDPKDLMLEYDPQWSYRFEELVGQYAKVPPSKMPLGMIARLSHHDFEQSNFFQDGNQEIVSRFVGLALDLVDHQLRESSKSSEGIFETFAPPAGRHTYRQVFSGAHYDGPQAKRTVREPPAYSQHPPLQEFLKGIVKHTENRLREATGFKTRLRSFEILDEHRAIIDRLIPVAKPEPKRTAKSKLIAPEPSVAPVRIELDLGRVQALQTESNEVREMLLSGLEDEVVIRPPVIVTAVPVPSIIEPVSVGSGWQALSSLLSDTQIEALRIVLEGQRVMFTLREIANREGTMPELLLDAINEAALETVGDAILDASGDEPAVYDDYSDDALNLVHSRNS
jgi:TerB N-terminal domain/TerB-C domain